MDTKNDILKTYIFKGNNIVVKEYSCARRTSVPEVKCSNDIERLNKIVNQLKKIYYLNNNKEVNYNFNSDSNEYDYCIYYDEYEKMLNYAENILYKQKRKNKYDSIKRSKQTVIDLAMSNPQLNSFMTLTFSDEVYADYNLAYEEFRKFRNRLNTYLKRNFNRNFNYIATFETTKRGRWHVHMLTDLDYRLFGFDEVENWYIKDKVKSEDKKNIENFISNKFWKNGFIDFTELENSDGSAYYLIKYLSKELNTENIGLEENIKRRFFTSKGLNRPLVVHVRVNDDKEKINALENQLKNIDLNDYKIKQTIYNDYTLVSNDFQPRLITETVYLKNVKLSNK